MGYQAIWRNPAEASLNLFPGLSVTDNMVSGSINVRHTRLPLWAIITTAIMGGWWDTKPQEQWGTVAENWPWVKDLGFTAEELAHFLYCLLEQRGEFGWLLLVLAAVEHREQKRTDRDLDARPWWEMPTERRRVMKQLRRCLAVLRQVEREAA